MKSIRYMTSVYNKTGAAARLMDCTAKVRLVRDCSEIILAFKLKAKILMVPSGDNTV